jgi:hypothetical protein
LEVEEVARWTLDDESEKPAAGSRKPEAGSGKLEAGSGKLEAGSWKPEAGSRKPEAGRCGANRHQLGGASRGSAPGIRRDNERRGHTEVVMLKRLCVCLALVGLLPAGALLEEQLPSPVAQCRHDVHSTQADRGRRNEAVTLAKAIHAAQADMVRRTQRYHPLASLRDLPAVPSGFTVHLYADGDGYIFAIKDTRDPCRFAVFSDTAGLLYEKNGYSAPVIAR